jgi:hypothetical protein
MQWQERAYYTYNEDLIQWRKNFNHPESKLHAKPFPLIITILIPLPRKKARKTNNELSTYLVNPPNITLHAKTAKEALPLCLALQFCLNTYISFHPKRK